MALESFASNTPENMSILQATKFTFLFPDMPYLKYFAQTISLPGVSTSEVMVPTPFVNTYRHGDKLNFEVFTITALMDEDLRLWEETYKWLKGLTSPTDKNEYLRKTIKSPPDKLYLDGFLTINTNSNRPNIKIKFRNCHPTSLGAINFDTKVDADTIPVCDITFRYDYYEIERV